MITLTTCPTARSSNTTRSFDGEDAATERNSWTTGCAARAHSELSRYPRNRRVRNPRSTSTLNSAAARAEALYAFADKLTKPVRPLLCPPPRPRTLSFGELAHTLRQSAGCDVSVATEIQRVWPQVHPITAVGFIDNVDET